MLADRVMEVVKMASRPEFINRLDDILLFHRLTREHKTGIVEGAIADGETVRGNARGIEVRIDACPPPRY